jgi:hypothetical protein
MGATTMIDFLTEPGNPQVSPEEGMKVQAVVLAPGTRINLRISRGQRTEWIKVPTTLLQIGESITIPLLQHQEALILIGKAATTKCQKKEGIAKKRIIKKKTKELSFRRRQFICVGIGLNISVLPANVTTTTARQKSLNGKSPKSGLIHPAVQALQGGQTTEAKTETAGIGSQYKYWGPQKLQMKGSNIPAAMSTDQLSENAALKPSLLCPPHNGHYLTVTPVPVRTPHCHLPPATQHREDSPCHLDMGATTPPLNPPAWIHVIDNPTLTTMGTPIILATPGLSSHTTSRGMGRNIETERGSMATGAGTAIQVAIGQVQVRKLIPTAMRETEMSEYETMKPDQGLTTLQLLEVLCLLIMAHVLESLIEITKGIHGKQKTWTFPRGAPQQVVDQIQGLVHIREHPMPQVPVLPCL